MVCTIRSLLLSRLLITSRAKACALTSSYPGSLHKGFPSYEEAEAYMLEHGCNNFFVDHELPSDRKRSREKYYAVAHGRKNGVFDVYEYDLS
jgi:viroplasmin and RNaseH domain-containing protein